MYRFEAIVQRGGEGGAWMLLMIPRSVSEAFGSRGRISVVGSVNGFAIKSSIFPNGDGTHHLMFNKAMQQGANATEGSVVVVELDAAPRKVAKKAAKPAAGDPVKALRSIAMRYPEVEEGIACKGTVLECSTFQARKKAFLFVSAKDARVKLGESLKEAADLEAKNPDGYQVGGKGWVKIIFNPDRPAPGGLMERWIDESYRLLAPKQRVAMLPERKSSTTNAKKKPAKKKVAAKKRAKKSASR